MKRNSRRPLVAVIGDARLSASDKKLAVAREIGQLLVESGCRVITGGLGGIMAAAMQGARQASNYLEGDTIAVLPGFDPADADESADIVIASGLSLARNMIVANSDAVIVVGGGAGTLSEIALAWQLRRPIVALKVAGWSKRFASARIDGRIRQTASSSDKVFGATTPVEAVQIALRLLPRYPKRMRCV